MEPLPQGPLALGPVPLVVYAAMFGGTVAGQLVGMVAGSAVGHRPLWLPVACSVLLEALVGTRLGAARIGRALSAGECARVSTYYSMCFGAVTLPIAACSLASSKQDAAATPSRVAAQLGLALGVLVLWTVARHGVMALLSTRRSP